MKFQKGNKAAKGGRRNPPGGRPTKEQQEIKKEAAQIAKEFIETHVQGFLDSYLDLGTGKVIERLDKDGNVVKLVMLDPATVRHAIDKILPDEQMESPPVYQINFLRFGDNHPAQPSPEDITITPLAGNGKMAGPDRVNDLLPMPTAEQQTKLKLSQVKFHGFAYASGNGKRRQG